MCSKEPVSADMVILSKVEDAVRNGARLPRWGWPIPPSYNGATGQERIAGWQRLHLAQDQGWIPRPISCSICYCAIRLHAHTENYFRPLLVQPICQRCHFCLHRRFRSRDPWLALLVRAPPSADWARKIGLDELTRTTAIFLAQHNF